MPHAVAQALRRRGIDVETATEAELLGRPDPDYLSYGVVHQRVVVTNDPDFVELSREHLDHAGVAYYDQRRRSIGEVIALLVLMYEVYDSGEMVGRVEYL
jgi:hypothetical protein